MSTLLSVSGAFLIGFMALSTTLIPLYKPSNFDIVIDLIILGFLLLITFTLVKILNALNRAFFIIAEAT